MNRKPVENSIKLLQLMFPKELQDKVIQDKFIGVQSIKEVEAIAIIIITTRIVKQGLSKVYVTKEDVEVSNPRGRINISKTLAMQTMMHGKVLCSYEELSEDTYVNQIVKYALQEIKSDSKMTDDIRHKTIKTLANFGGVSSIERVIWKKIAYNNSTIRYKRLIQLCNRYGKEAILEHKINYEDKERLFNLFKEAYYSYYKSVYGKLNTVKILAKEFTDEPSYEKKVKQENSVIIVYGDKSAFIIDVKAYDCEAMKDTRLKNSQLSVIAKYIAEIEENTKLKTYGAIIYLNTKVGVYTFEDTQLITVDKKTIAMQVIDLTDPWKAATFKMDKLYKMFIIEQV